MFNINKKIVMKFGILPEQAYFPIIFLSIGLSIYLFLKNND